MGLNGRRRLLVLVLSLLVSGVLLEVAARVLVCVRTPAGMVFRSDVIYSFEPDTRVGSVVLNNMGCVGDDLEVGERQTLRVMLLGGSTSFSQIYVDSVRARLSDRLDRKDVEVVSCGKPRYTSHVNRVQLEQLAPRYRPDVVVLYLGINDNISNTFPWVDGLPDVGYLDWRDPWPPLAAELIHYHLIQKRLLSVPDFGLEDLRSVALFRANLEAMVAVARAHGALPVLATFAVALPSDDPALEELVRSQEGRMEHFWGRVDSTLLGVAAHNRVMVATAQEQRLPLARVAEQMPRDSSHFLDLCHLTGTANRILGTTIADSIVEGLTASDPSTFGSAPRSRAP